MSTYIHPNGISVERSYRGGVLLPQVSLNSDEVAAIHAAFLAELGLWLDEETGCLVDTASRHAPSPTGGTSYNVLRRELGGHLATDDGWAGQIHPNERDQAVDRHIATLTPPQPEPQPGEVWEVTRAGKKVRAIVSPNGGLFVFGPDECQSVSAAFCTDRRLLITADGERVGGES